MLCNLLRITHKISAQMYRSRTALVPSNLGPRSSEHTCRASRIKIWEVPYDKLLQKLVNINMIIKARNMHLFVRWQQSIQQYDLIFSNITAIVCLVRPPHVMVYVQNTFAWNKYYKDGYTESRIILDTLNKISEFSDKCYLHVMYILVCNFLQLRHKAKLWFIISLRNMWFSNFRVIWQRFKNHVTAQA
jgi:hypothetical protein